MFKRVLRSRLTYLLALLTFLTAAVWLHWWWSQQAKPGSGDLRDWRNQVFYDLWN